MSVRTAIFTLGVAFALLSPTNGNAQLAKSGAFEAYASFGWTGTNYAVADGHIYWIGESRGVILNKSDNGFLHQAAVVCPSYADIKGSAIATGGYCTTTDSDGDTITILNKGQTASGGAGGEIEGTGFSGTCVDGTGKYKGIKCEMKTTYRDVAYREAGAAAQGEGLAEWKGTWQLP